MHLSPSSRCSEQGGIFTGRENDAVMGQNRYLGVNDVYFTRRDSKKYIVFFHWKIIPFKASMYITVYAVTGTTFL